MASGMCRAPLTMSQDHVEKYQLRLSGVVWSLNEVNARPWHQHMSPCPVVSSCLMSPCGCYESLNPQVQARQHGFNSPESEATGWPFLAFNLLLPAAIYFKDVDGCVKGCPTAASMGHTSGLCEPLWTCNLDIWRIMRYQATNTAPSCCYNNRLKQQVETTG